jgi:PAS domain-containing protein
MSFLSNPMMFRIILASAVLLFTCFVGLISVRHLRRSMLSSADPAGATGNQPFALHAYHAVIQQLKQQKHELLTEQRADRRRARTTENISAAVLSNLSSGVVFFSSNGLVRQANNAAKEILGFASLVGMNADAVFRQASASGSSRETTFPQQILTHAKQKTPTHTAEIRYITPTGAQRALEITITSVCMSPEDVLGAACLIRDRTDIARIQKQQELQQEISAEMALALHTSVATLSGHARQVVAARDLDRARELATDIISEAEDLDHTIGGFLAGASASVAGD